MYRKFACLNYVRSRDEIPIKTNYLKNNLNKGIDFDKYVQTYNPFIASGVKIFSESGYMVKLPLTAPDIEKWNDMTQNVISRTIDALYDYNVEIILPPKNFPYPIAKRFRIADGQLLWPFFIPSAIKKLLKDKKNIQQCEILIIAGGKSVTTCLIDNLSECTNFLSVMDLQNDLNIYNDLREEIFQNSGLDIMFSTYNKSLAKSADVIIKASDAPLHELDYSYKKGALFIDITDNSDIKKERARRREDMQFVDSLQIRVGKEQMSLLHFELAYYIKSRDYRNLLLRGYNLELAAIVRDQLSRMNINIAGLSFSV